MRAFFAGVCGAVLAPSSTTMSVLAVQSVREGHLPPRRVLPLMLGADVGAHGDGAAGGAAAGPVRPRFRRARRLGFPFGSPPRVRDLGRLLALATGHPVLLAALAAVLAIGLGMGVLVAVAGADPLRLAVPMVIGANVGTGVTLLMLGWRQTDARRLAVGNLLFKSTTAALALLLLGFVIDNSLSMLVMKRAQHDLWSSDAGWAELDGFYSPIAETAFATRDPRLAERLIRHKPSLNARERALRTNHFERLHAGQKQSFESSAVHLDILTHPNRINSGLTHVAYGVLDGAG